MAALSSSDSSSSASGSSGSPLSSRWRERRRHRGGGDADAALNVRKDRRLRGKRKRGRRYRCVSSSSSYSDSSSGSYSDSEHEASNRSKKRKHYGRSQSKDKEKSKSHHLKGPKSKHKEIFSRFRKDKGKGKERSGGSSNRSDHDFEQVRENSCRDVRIIERRPSTHNDAESLFGASSPDIADDNDYVRDISTSNQQFKVYLQPDGYSGFVPSKPAAAALGKVIRQRYEQSWLSWKEIPPATRQMWFREFEADVWWDAENNELMWKIFNTRCSKRLSSMLFEARAANVRPNWISENIWIDLLSKWSTEDYKNKREKAKANRASEQNACLYAGGCISRGTTAQRMEMERGEKPTEDEIFLRTHHRKDKGWVSDFAKNTYEGFKAKQAEHITQVTQEGGTPKSTRELWREHVGKNKNRVYGLGSSVTSVDLGSSRRSISGPSNEEIERRVVERLKQMEQQMQERFEVQMEQARRAQRKEMNEMWRLMMKGQAPPEDPDEDNDM